MNQLYDDARERMLSNRMNWEGMTCVLLAYDNLSYVFSPLHLTQGDVGTPKAVSQPLITPLVAPGGYARTSAGVFVAIGVGPAIQFLVLAEQNNTPINRKLIAYCDQASGLPFTPNGGDWIVKPDWAHAQGWFRA